MNTRLISTGVALFTADLVLLIAIVFAHRMGPADVRGVEATNFGMGYRGPEIQRSAMLSWDAAESGAESPSPFIRYVAAPDYRAQGR